MSDLISRKALIEKIRKYGICGSGYSDEERINDVIDMIESEPPVEPPKGEWEECDWVEYDGHGECIHYSKEALRCSNCCNAFKKELLWKDNFCPNCGARMKGK